MAKVHKRQLNHPHSFLPDGLLKFFAVAAFLLVPWSIFLSQFLPSDHLARGWNFAWTGFDLGLVISLGLTALLGLGKSGWVIVPASVAGTMLLIDAWFDCLMAKQGWEHIASICSATCLEVPMALMAFWIAYCAGRHYIKKK